MDNIQIPTVGRIVHFFPNGNDAHCAANRAEFVPAMVIQSFAGSATLNLGVFAMNGDGPLVLRYSVVHRSVAESSEGTFAFWDWPEKK